MIKAIKILAKWLLKIVLVAMLYILLIGGGWGSKAGKSYPENHLLYRNDITYLAHRGVADIYPENTLEAAQRALDLGFKWIEIDVKESADGVFFLFHDRDGQRLLGTDQTPSSFTWDELKVMPLWFDETPTAYRIPRLQEFLDQFGDKFIIYFDVKRHGNDRYQYLADKWYNIIKENGLIERSIIGSDFLFTAYLEFRYPDLHTVFTGPGDGFIKVYPLIPLNYRPDFIISYGEEVTAAHIEWLRKKQLLNRRLIYGVKSHNYQELLELGIPKIVVDTTMQLNMN